MISSPVSIAYANPSLSYSGGERFAEDWSRMDDPQARTRPWHRLKWIDLGRDARLSMGADAKWRSEYIDAPFFGTEDSKPDFYTLQRFLVHADLHLSSNVRVFTQLGFHKGIGRKAYFPFDDDRIDLQQSFVDVTAGIAERGVGARIGRQEIVLSPRFVPSRGALNIRAAFDGVRGWVRQGPLTLDAFATHPVLNNAGSFDNRRDRNQTFDGIRAIYTFGKTNHWRVIGSYYRIDRSTSKIGDTDGREDRRSWGLRLSKDDGKWFFDAEHYHQNGTFAGQAIDAFGGGGALNHIWRNSDWRHSIGVRWLYGSGDSNPGDSEVTTFFGPRARPPCCEDALWLSPSNLAVLSPVFAIQPGRNLLLEFKVDFATRLRPEDGIYTAARQPYDLSFDQSGGNLISITPGVRLKWSPIPEVSINAHMVLQSTKGALAALGASNSTFSVFSVAVSF